MRLSRTSRLIVVNFLVLAGLVVVVELIARSLYPELANDVHSEELSRGVKHSFTNFHSQQVRIPYVGYDLTLSKQDKLIIILGDSVSRGYGLDFDDIYWAKFQRIMDAVCLFTPKVVAFSELGNNLGDAANALEGFIEADETPSVCAVIYQFNYNDITPYNKTFLKAQAPSPPGGWAFAKWYYKWLNRMVSFRVAQYYSVWVLARIRTGCQKNQGLALRQYSWAYGSKSIKDESEKAWNEFEKDLERLYRTTSSMNSRLYVLISPLLYHIDKDGKHPYYNIRAYDWSCATIDPSPRLAILCDRLGIQMIDPTAYVRDAFDRRIKGNNFSFFYFPTDDNHFTEIVSTYVAEYMAKSLLVVQSPCGLKCGQGSLQEP